LFFIGKILRLAIGLFFLFGLQQTQARLGGYTTGQMMVFFLVFQFLDTFAQILYRGVYFFSWQVRSGELDMLLTKPLHPLFSIMTGHPDILDAIFFIPTTLLSIWIAAPALVHLEWSHVVLFVIMAVNSFLIITALHIVVVCLGVVTTEVDNAVMLYRDINAMGRFPIDVYREPFRTVLFFGVPIGVINTLPSQVLLGTAPTIPIVLACGVGLVSLWASLLLWRWSVKQYTSAGG
jgi:ABC-2 type transport system permease protein